MKQSVKSAVLSLASGSGYLALRRWAGRSRFRIVTYHGVQSCDQPVVNVDRLQADPEIFEKQLVAFSRAYRVIGLHDAVRNFVELGAWPRRALAITFDDGYRNNLEVAAPILRRLGLPATFFVTAGFIGGYTKPWWYVLRAWLQSTESNAIAAARRAVELESMLRPLSEAERHAEMKRLGVPASVQSPFPFMNREDCLSLIAQGFDVQCHGDTHVSFGAETSEKLKQEITASATFIRSIGHTPWAFAYPYGHEPRDFSALKSTFDEEGIIAALTTKEGANRPGDNLMSLRRWDLHGGYSPLAALARVS